MSLQSRRRASVSGLEPVVVIPLLDHAQDGELPDVPLLLTTLEKTEALKLIDHNTQRKLQSLITITASTTIAAAVHTLASNKILSAPVMSDDSQSCLGSIDLIAIVDFVVNHVVVNHAQSGQVTDILTPQQIASSPVSFLFQQPFLKPHLTLTPFYEHNSADLLLDLFAAHVYRVALTTSSNEISCIISQSDLIHFIDNLFGGNQCPTLKAMPIKSLPLNKNRELVTVNETITVRLAVQILISKQVSSVGIVHTRSGKLLGDFSASGLRGLTDFRQMSLNLVDFLTRHHQRSLTPQTIAGDTGDSAATLGDIVHRMAENRCHRVWIVDGEQKPLDVITSTDIMRLVSSKRAISDTQASGSQSTSNLWLTPKPVFNMPDYSNAEII